MLDGIVNIEISFKDCSQRFALLDWRVVLTKIGFFCLLSLTLFLFYLFKVSLEHSLPTNGGPFSWPFHSLFKIVTVQILPRPIFKRTYLPGYFRCHDSSAPLASFHSINYFQTKFPLRSQFKDSKYQILNIFPVRYTIESVQNVCLLDKFSKNLSNRTI